jgi:hypothetical protein
LREFELTNNNCLRIFEVHKIGYKENKGGRKSYDNKRWHCHMKLDRNRVKRKILLNCYTFKSVLTKDKTHTDTYILERWAIF